MRVVVLGALLLATGCDALFGLDHVRSDAPASGDDDAHVIDAMGDARMIDALNDAGRTPGCPTNYVTVNLLPGRYRVASTAMVDWPGAEALCEADRGNYALYTHLVVFADENERSMMNAALSGQIFWIGLSDRTTDGVYKWVSNENPVYPISSAWHNGAPDNTPGADCGEMMGNGDLQVVGCTPTQGLKYICECDTHAVDTTHF